MPKSKIKKIYAGAKTAVKRKAAKAKKRLKALLAVDKRKKKKGKRARKYVDIYSRGQARKKAADAATKWKD